MPQRWLSLGKFNSVFGTLQGMHRTLDLYLGFKGICEIKWQVCVFIVYRETG